MSDERKRILGSVILINEGVCLCINYTKRGGFAVSDDSIHGKVVRLYLAYNSTVEYFFFKKQ